MVNFIAPYYNQRIMLRSFVFFYVVITILVFTYNLKAQVDVHEDSITIPTYIVEPPNPMPRFYEGTSHQGVQRRIYPYPMNDNLTRKKVDKNYHIIIVSNEFIEIGIMPGLGGRVFYAKDKTNGYNWFYRQHVIKPSLIGMLGYWISGSLAWGFPHHHGPNTVKPMDYYIVSNPDCSKTIWIADFDLRHRMKILIGYTVFPHSSLIEMTVRPYNRTPIVNSFLFWANPSVHVDTNYQVIFPPSVKFVTQHAKYEMATWPVADRRYNNFNYKGIDISWWKNIGVPSSFFAWNPKEDYFGGYDYGRNAGTVWIGNHYVCPGMKFWAWGNNLGGDRANAGLTDNDGHYIELMAGAFTDNQPDYSWIQPYEYKDVKMIWYPIRNLEGLKYANRFGALNIETKNNKVIIRINTTSPYKKASLVFKAKEKIIFKDSLNISPAQPYLVEIDLPTNTKKDDINLSLFTSNGYLILSYSPAEHKPSNDIMPEPLRPPKPPDEIKSVEELYLTGLRLNQFYNANLDPMQYYEEALRRDPGNYRVNTQLGILALKSKNLIEAKKRFRIAVERVTANYTRPKDGEALYYLGYTLKLIGKYNEAYDYLYRATWSYAWHSAAYYQLAEIDCINKDFEKALEHLNKSISTNTENIQALSLRVVVLRKLGRIKEAYEQIDEVLKKDILNHWARNEMTYILLAQDKYMESKCNDNELTKIMRDDVQSYLELSLDYSNAGFIEEAINVLNKIEKRRNNYPLLYYYLGYYWFKAGNENNALKYFELASTKPYEYCFPYRLESINVLNVAMKMNPKDAKAPYYLGNLYYEDQPQKAIELWEISRNLDSSFYIIHRNLALAYEKIQNNSKKAVVSMEKAISNNNDDPRLLFEMDMLYDKIKASSDKKYLLLKNNFATAKRRTETLLRLATRAVEVGNYEEALQILQNNDFPQFEGAREMQDTYLNAYVLRGMKFFEQGELNLALKDFQSALNYPLERWGRSRLAQFYYLIGTVYEKLGDKKKSFDYYNECLNVDVDDRGEDQEYYYYHGLSLKKLGKYKEAEELFSKLLASVQSQDNSSFFRQFEGGLSKDRQAAAKHYLIGLAYEGLNQKEKAKAEYLKALELNPSHVWSKYHLSKLLLK